jgi:hypothetical protein
MRLYVYDLPFHVEPAVCYSDYYILGMYHPGMSLRDTALRHDNSPGNKM